MYTDAIPYSSTNRLVRRAGAVTRIAIILCLLVTFAVNGATAQPAQKTPPEQVAAASTAVRTAVVDVLVIFLAGVFVISLVWEMRRQSIIIDPIAMPEQLTKEGYTSQVVAERIRSEIAALRRAARIEGPEEGYELSASQVDFTVPTAGVSFRNALRFIRQIFGRPEQRVTGEVVLEAVPAELKELSGTEKRLRIVLRTRDAQMASSDVRVSADVGISKLIEHAAYDIVMLLDPYTIAAYWLSAEQPRETFQTTVTAVRECLAKSNLRHHARAYVIWGNALAFNRQFDEAEAKYKAAVALDPYRTALHIAWGNMLRQQRRFDDAADRYLAAIAIDSRDAVSWTNLGNVYIDRRRFPDAIRCLHRAIALNRRYAPAWNSLGYAFFRMYKFSEAEEKLARAIDLEPQLGWPRLNMARVFYAQRRQDDAVAMLTTAAALPATSADAYVLWGDILRDLRDFDGAAAKYAKANAAKPWLGLGYGAAAALLRDQRLWPEAIRSAGRALEANRHNVVAWSAVAETFLRIGRYTEAEEKYRQALAVDPYFSSARIGLGHTLRLRHRYKEALRTFNEATKADPFETWGWRSLGDALLDRHSPLAAIAQFRRALQVNPHDSAAYSSWARALANCGKHEQAREQAVRACKSETGHNPAAWRQLADALVELGRAEEAIRTLQDGLARWPWSAELAYRSAEILRLHERRKEALAAYDHAIAIDGGFANAFNGASAMMMDMRLNEAALRVARHAFRLESWNDSSRAIFGDALFRSGREKEAEKWFASAPETLTVLFHWGRALEVAKHSEAAQEKYQRMTEIDAYDADAHLRIGHLLRQRTGEAKAGLEHFMRAVEIDRFNEWAWRSWGDALLDLDQPEKALQRYSVALQIKPRNAYAYVGCSRAASKLRDPENALRYAQEAFTCSRNAGDFKGVAKYMIALGHPEAALAEIGKALQENPESADLLFVHAELLRSMNRESEARPLEENAGRIYRDDAAALVAWSRRVTGVT